MSESAKEAGKRTASDAGQDTLVSASKSPKQHDTDSPSNLATKPGISTATDFQGAVRKLHDALSDNQKARIEQQAERAKKALKNVARTDHENLQRKYRDEQARVEMLEKLKMNMMDELMLSGKAELKKELEHDVREELKAELKAELKLELRECVYADYAKEYEQHKKAKTLELEKELTPVVKDYLEAEFTRAVYLELRMEMGQDEETRVMMRAELKADMAEDIKNELMQELAPSVAAELRGELAPVTNPNHSADTISSGQDNIAGPVDGKVQEEEEETSNQQDQAAEHTNELHHDPNSALKRGQPVEDKDANFASNSEEPTVSNTQESGADNPNAKHPNSHDSTNDGPAGEDTVRGSHHNDETFAAISQSKENFSPTDAQAAGHDGDDHHIAENADYHHVSRGPSLDDYEDEEDIPQGDNKAANHLGTNGQASQNFDYALNSYPTQRRMSDNTGTSKDDPIELDSDSDGEEASEKDSNMGSEDEEAGVLFPTGEGLHITYDGYVADIFGRSYGVLVTDNLHDVIGFAVNEMGDVLDHQGRVVGMAGVYQADEDEVQDDGLVGPATRYAGAPYQGSDYEDEAEQYEDGEFGDEDDVAGGEYAHHGYGEYSRLARFQHGSVSPVDTDDEIDEAAASMGYGPARSSSAPVSRRSGEYEDTPLSSHGQPAFHPATSTSSGPYHQPAQRDPSRYNIDEDYDEDYDNVEDADTTLVGDDLPATINETQVLGTTKEKSLFLNSDSDSD